jgi:adenosylcobinamide kinase/adenosylcobinamide-phosphate guanylyltransferase
MNTLISGGCKNGKSFYAQEEARRLAERIDVPMYYLATMIPRDEEDRARVKRHKEERRGWGFVTIEQSVDICGALDRADRRGVFLLDSVTALLSNEMFADSGGVNREASQKVKADLLAFAKKTGNTLFVTDYIYSDAVRYDSLTEAYRKGLAAIDRALAEVCGRVIEVAYGRMYDYRGSD